MALPRKRHPEDRLTAKRTPRSYVRELALWWGLGEVMGVGASMRARVICERASLLMGVSFKFIWVSFRIIGFLLKVFCPGGNLLLRLC